jgi:hypothetical protein
MPPTEVSIETHLAFLRRPQGRPKCFDLSRPDQQGCRGSAQLLILRSAMVVRNSSREFYPSTASGWLGLGNTPVPGSPPTGNGVVMSIRDSGNAGQRCYWWFCPRGGESARPPRRPAKSMMVGGPGLAPPAFRALPAAEWRSSLRPRRSLAERQPAKERKRIQSRAGFHTLATPVQPGFFDQPVSKRGTKHSAAVSNM